MKVKVVTGFLGVGKTTFLKMLLDEAGPGTAVLINEFGPLGIDKALVEQGRAADIVELPSGCICCSLQRDLVSTILEIMEKANPQRLIIEPSGVATTSGILKALSVPELAGKVELEAVVGIVDATSILEDLEEGAFGTFFLDQITQADVLLVNKIDLVTPEEVNKAMKEIRRINVSAVILPTVYCQADLHEGAWGEVASHGIQLGHIHFAPGLDTVVFTFSGEFSRERIESMLTELSGGAFGQIVRAKGIFVSPSGPMHFDYVQGKQDFGLLKSIAENRFVFIGKDLQRELLEKALVTK